VKHNSVIGTTFLPVLFAGVFLATSSLAQATLVNVTSCGPATFPGTTCTIPATGAGHLIAVGWQTGSMANTAATIGVSDNAGNVYFEAARAIDSSAGAVVDLWYAKNSSAGATTINITPSETVTNAGVVVWEFAGVDPNSSLDQTAVLNNQPVSSTVTGGSISTSASNEAVISLAAASGGNLVLAAGSAFTSDSTLKGNGWSHAVPSSAGAYSAQWVENPSGTFAGASASFRAAATGGGGTGYSPCDLNHDGVINSTDVSQAVATITNPPANCPATINGAGSCNAAVTQRVVAAAQPGGTCHPVAISWTASTSPNLAGYNIYRSLSSSSGYSKLNSSLINGTTYIDGTSQAGQTYYYVVTAVDTSSNESAYSSPPVAAAVPSP